jgi:5-methylcytosine-specific restriction endonuclease McrA
LSEGSYAVCWKTEKSLQQAILQKKQTKNQRSYRQKTARPHLGDHVKYVREYFKRKSKGSFSQKQWIVLKNQYGKCLCCGLTEKQLKKVNRKLVSDHVVPLSKGGSNTLSNIQPLCHGRGGCNNKKKDKHIDYRI